LIKITVKMIQNNPVKQDSFRWSTKQSNFLQIYCSV